jgi:hypothetical protein
MHTTSLEKLLDQLKEILYDLKTAYRNYNTQDIMISLKRFINFLSFGNNIYYDFVVMVQESGCFEIIKDLMSIIHKENIEMQS